MKEKPNSTHITLWANRALAVILTVLLFTLPALLDWYCSIRNLTSGEHTAIAVAFYICAVIELYALWQMEKLLKNLLKKQVFLTENVDRVRRIRWCCAGVSLVCLPAALLYYPLIFMVMVMGFLCLVISVVCRVLDEAVSLREENDLTI